MSNLPLYSIGVWDADLQSYWPLHGCKACLNITRAELRTRIQSLRDMGYSAHRKGNIRDGHDDNDFNVLIERTDGRAEVKILESWKHA